MPSPRIEVRGVTRSFGAVRALDGVSLSVDSGRMVGLIGHNGAGKSTLFKLMLGLLQPGSGEILLDGEPIAGPRFRDARRRIGYLPESFAPCDHLSGIEVLYLFADLKRVPRNACAVALARVGLAQAGARRVRGYSKGMRQRLGLAQALLGEPDLVFLDEPTNGLDPEGIHDFYRILRQLQDGGATIVITSHILADIQDRVDQLVILRSGRVAAQGSLATLRAALPLREHIEALARPGEAARVEAALAQLEGVTLERAGDRVCAACPPQQKMQALALLAALGGAVLDLRLREASLEQLFLGYGGRHGAH